MSGLRFGRAARVVAPLAGFDGFRRTGGRGGLARVGAVLGIHGGADIVLDALGRALEFADRLAERTEQFREAFCAEKQQEIGLKREYR